MYSPLYNITITQRPPLSGDFPNHNKVIRLDFLESYQWLSVWQNLTSKGRITIPKQLTYKDEDNADNPLNGSAVNVGGFNSEPLFLRGDTVALISGYKYYEDDRVVDDTETIIAGYISRVFSKIPIELEIEDNMWLLKQTPMANKSFGSGDTLQSILAYIVKTVNDMHGVMLTYSADESTSFGALIVGHETAAELLNRIHSLYGIYSYFRGNELRSGVKIYDEANFNTLNFIMNGEKANIPAEGQDLEYQRKDDVVLSAIAHNTITKETGATCKDGSAKTKRERLQVLVTIRNGQKETEVISSGERVPENTEGERRTFFFPDATTTEQLADKAYNELKLFYYTGLKGKFQTFGIPYVKHGDQVNIKNPQLPEQDGVYKVKSVEYSGGEDGLRQTIELHYKVS